ncbi:MAG TPA: hypothetical protein VJT83_01540 [Chitinophagaceae bacterium]|nr:hypothetical protein [Chitinophagaceae bacterium]
MENNYSGFTLPELLDLLSKKTEQYNKYLLSGASPTEKKKIKEELRLIQEEIKTRDH